MPRTLIRSVLFVATCLSAFAVEDKNQPKSSDDSQWLRAASEQINLLKEAIKHYQRASSMMTWSSAGQSLRRGSDIDAAIAEYRKALEEDPDEPYWHLALAMALKQKGDRQGILDDYEAALKLAPDDDALRRAYDSLLAAAPDERAEASGVDGETSGVIYNVGPGVSAPRCAHCPDPPYTKKARAGWYSPVVCIVKILVNPQGDVESAQVVKPVGLGLDENTLNTVRTWKFSPAMREGVPVSVRLLVETSFSLF